MSKTKWMRSICDYDVIIKLAAAINNARNVALFLLVIGVEVGETYLTEILLCRWNVFTFKKNLKCCQDIFLYFILRFKMYV